MSKISEYSELVQPTHINTAGTLFGGYMLAWLDLAAAKAATSKTHQSRDQYDPSIKQTMRFDRSKNAPRAAMPCAFRASSS